ncbi:MAG: DNA adenine methylase [Treponema sp.]|jgi:adenine-specific DNA-methyltransferase|nr:DNA adenine methylase [Treponema sp.]
MEREVPATQGIKYAGSKLKLLPRILSLARKVKPSTVFDGFAGSTRVSQAFSQEGCAVYSKVFNTAYLLNQKEPAGYGELIDYLNSLKPVDGWFTEHYGGLDDNGKSLGHDGLKSPWQRKNTRKLDTVR